MVAVLTGCKLYLYIIHNSFIPSLDKLEKEKSDDAFAEGLATFIGADRSDDEISITRKGK